MSKKKKSEGGPGPSLFSEAEGGWEGGGTRVTARFRLSIVASGRRRRILKIGACGAACGPCQEAGNCQWFFWDGGPEGEPGHRQAHNHGH
jgi:hypothetical protein